MTRRGSPNSSSRSNFDQNGTFELAMTKTPKSTSTGTTVGVEEVADSIEVSSTRKATRSFSFVPLFVPSRTSNLLHDDGLVEDEGDILTSPTGGRGGGVKASSNSGGNIDYHSPQHPNMGRRRRSKAGNNNGPMVRRLTSIRTMRGNDSLRLYNEAFARSRTVVDANDPRKRANTYADVTLLGRYNGPWADLPEDYKITLLGYAHRHVPKKKTTGWHYQPQRLPVTFLSEGTYSWFTFTLTTARNVNLQQSCCLRIYNPVILPCPSIKVSNIQWPPSGVDSNNGNAIVDGYCSTHVICTHLCERLDSIPSS
jgi:hypothetical protein